MTRPELEKNAAGIIRNLLTRFWDGKTLAHAYFENTLQKQTFLSDAASVLTAMTMLFENDKSWSGLMDDMIIYVESFKEGDKWIESGAGDFQKVYASWLDHPVPSSVSLAEMGLARAHC